MRNNRNYYLPAIFLFFFLPGCAGTIGNMGDVYQDPRPGYNLIFEAKTDKLSAYPNEPVILNYKLLTRYDTRYEGFKVESRLPGVWIENIPYPKEIERRVVKRNNFKMVWAPVRKQILFPMKPGVVTIYPGTVKIGYLKVPSFNSVGAFFNSPAFGKNYSYLLMENPPIEIEVKDFPTVGKPKNFSGAYGDFTLKAAYGGTTEEGLIKVNLTIAGTGNFYALDTPALQLDSDLKVVDVVSVVNAAAKWKDPALRGSKTFEWKLLPSRTGAFILPSINFSYFNQNTKAYQSLLTESISFQVDKLARNVEKPNKQSSGLIVLFDISGSMQALDYSPKSRFDIEKRIGSEIIEHVHFNFLRGKTFAATVTDLFDDKMSSQDKSSLIQNMKVAEGEKDGTALGDSLYDAMASLKKFITEQGKKQIILFTDGQNNKGHLDPETVTDLARKSGVIIHAVAIGSKDRVLFPVKRGNQTVLEMADVGTASENLRVIAEQTGGRFYKIEGDNDANLVVPDLLSKLKV